VTHGKCSVLDHSDGKQEIPENNFSERRPNSRCTERLTPNQLHAVALWLRDYAGSRPVGGNRNLSIYLILPVALGPGVYLTVNRNEYQKQ
jgi:hypothetical protein